MGTLKKVTRKYIFQLVTLQNVRFPHMMMTGQVLQMERRAISASDCDTAEEIGRITGKFLLAQQHASYLAWYRVSRWRIFELDS